MKMVKCCQGVFCIEFVGRFGVGFDVGGGVGYDVLFGVVLLFCSGGVIDDELGSVGSVGIFGICGSGMLLCGMSGSVGGNGRFFGIFWRFMLKIVCCVGEMFIFIY